MLVLRKEMSSDQDKINALESKVRQLDAENQEIFNSIYRLFSDEPDEKGNYFHLIICNGGRHYPIGAEGKLCNCKNSRLFKRLYETLYNECSRLRRGEFNDYEFQNFCHNLSEEKKEEFFKGCNTYQNKLFGQSERQRMFEQLKPIYEDGTTMNVSDGFQEWFQEEFKDELNKPSESDKLTLEAWKMIHGETGQSGCPKGELGEKGVDGN